MFDPNPATVLSIFNAPQRVVVPRYQRNFAWGRNEAQELVEDVKAKCDDQKFNLFLGTVVFDVSGTDTGEVAVIDGQQRLTTSSVLLIACRQAAKKRSAPFADAIQERIAFKNPYTGNYEGQRLVVSPSIKDIYEYMASSEWTGQFPDKVNGRSVKRQVNKLKPLYDFFSNEIKSLDIDELQNFVRALYDAYFIRIDIENTSQAFDIFERMNARGVPLDVADLLKNHLFANLDTDTIEEKWFEIMENSGSTPLRMLKYFWVSKEGYVRKSELYRRIRDYSLKAGPEKLVAELEDFSLFFWLIREGEVDDLSQYFADKGLDEIVSNESYVQQIFSAIEALRLFRITQLYPVLYASIGSYAADKKRNAKDLIELFSVFEKYHFINNVICERVGNEVEILYTQYAKDFNEGSFKALSTGLKKDLKSRLADEAEFVSNFSTVSYAADSIGLICYIFDRINNTQYRARGGQRVKMFYPVASVQKKNFNVEHFLSQKEKKNVAADKDTLESIDNIGNLLVIARHTNSDLGSLTPAEKIRAFQNKPVYISNLPYLTDFVKIYGQHASEWDKHAIAKRAEELATLGYTKIWNV